VIILQVQGAEAIDLSLANTYIWYSWNHSLLQVQGAEAIDLSLANTYIWYSWNHSLINFEQARFRVQSFDTEQVNYWFLIARDTVDEDLYDVVVKKKNLATLICDRYRHEKH
jgi:hypothetical protein